MNKAIQILLIVVCLPLLLLGLGAMFNPMGMLERFAVQPEGIHGLSTLRGDIGGLLLGSAAMILIGVWRSNTTWFLAVALMMATVAFGRLIGFVVDGVDPAVVPPFVVELVIAGVMIAAHKKLAPAQS